MTSRSVLSRPNGFAGVVVATGHLTDTSTRTAPRFPEERVEAVRARLSEVFAGWGVDERWLLICGGARGGDLLAAEVARARGATVWVLLAHPAEHFVETSVAGGAAHWTTDFWNLLARTPSWSIETDQQTPRGDQVYGATNAWMLEVALTQAGSGAAHLVAVWDGEGARGEGGTAEMVRSAGGEGIATVVIDPMA